MMYSYEKFPCSPKKISICDAQIDKINCSHNTIRFLFPKGFSVISCDRVDVCSRGYIELLDCDADEFNCHIIHRESTPSGARLFGEPVSLIELASILDSEDRKIEIFLELYDFNYLYWRGVLLPYKTQGLSDNVVIETSGCFPMTYYWEQKTQGIEKYDGDVKEQFYQRWYCNHRFREQKQIH